MPPGWYPDPGDPNRIGWWNGIGWSGAMQLNPSPAALPGQYPLQIGSIALRPPDGGGVGIFSLILAIFALFTVWVPFFIGLILGGGSGIVALILGIIGANRNVTNKGPAVAGIVIGGLVVLLLFLGGGTFW
ncbi:MAG TPA: DUF2510 domain-containing protein [Micrococcaceae bacterium]|nr:DUF2510 domain-containing protein [Micrococcaceae bacterium]